MPAITSDRGPINNKATAKIENSIALGDLFLSTRCRSKTTVTSLFDDCFDMFSLMPSHTPLYICRFVYIAFVNVTKNYYRKISYLFVVYIHYFILHTFLSRV